MAMTLKPGTRLFSAVCSAEMIVVKAPTEEVDLTVGGLPPLLSSTARIGETVVEGHGGGAATGKRYVDESQTIELLCTKPGQGVPAVNGNLLQLKDAKPLPSSD